jgi:hypothetical protein
MGFESGQIRDKTAHVFARSEHSAHQIGEYAIRPTLPLQVRASSNAPSRPCASCQSIFQIHDQESKAQALLLSGKAEAQPAL